MGEAARLRGSRGGRSFIVVSAFAPKRKQSLESSNGLESTEDR
jgi:hypothetical protein